MVKLSKNQKFIFSDFLKPSPTRYVKIQIIYFEYRETIRITKNQQGYQQNQNHAYIFFNS